MKAFLIFLSICAASLVTAPVPTTAQGNMDSVRGFIERNAELLGVATAVVQETNSIRARGLLETATTLHKQSVGLLEQNSNAQAGRVAVRAREVIQQTISVAKRDARIEEQAVRTMERATTRLEQARIVFEEDGNDKIVARRLILESADNLRRAREQVQQHMFETSLRLAESSLALSNRAIRMLRRDGLGPDVAEEIDRTQSIIERAGESRASHDPALNRLLEQANELQRRAVRSAERGDAAIAVEQTRGARNLALRAMRAGGGAGASDEEQAVRAVALTDAVLEGARDVLGESAHDGATRRVEEAARQQDDARRALGDGDYKRALALSTSAREAVRAALRGMDVAVDPASVESALARTDDAITKLGDTIAGSDRATAREFFERATSRQREARAALGDGDPRRALALTRVAHNLARSGLSAMKDAEN
ncbi:MAG: hypothetical protein OEX18_01685 [Candidatus Krumholzibacteria bacterium]|nr:hypothetical protein [Candidatus Krumholzibacteria bacterium]MDH4335970.1 hypothetical protein [Candidatus Krumholzibacteria bacterium]MDH5268454.1 hypothetical protein [Candidatus Krumholzibacteria bacterium]